MNLRDSLTKENFWKATMEQFPKSTKLFYDWIDEYKKASNWDNLFGAHETKMNGSLVCMGYAPKFHELPYDMQAGIWIRFVNDTLPQFFEQPEYEYSFDLEEDVKTVFGEIEQEIDED